MMSYWRLRALVHSRSPSFMVFSPQRGQRVKVPAACAFLTCAMRS